MNLDVFEIVVDRRVDRRAYVLRWRSHIYGLDRALELNHRWVRSGCNPEELVRFIQRLVGDTLRHYDQMRARFTPEDISHMAVAWDNAIAREMERMEREGRRSRPPMYDHQFDALRFDPVEYNYDFGVPYQEDKKAIAKARELLLRNLDAGQAKSFSQNESFRVTAKGGKKYTITAQRSFNVIAEDGDSYCGQLTNTPIYDQMLAQKLLLQNDPDKFFKNANRRYGGTATTTGAVTGRMAGRSFAQELDRLNGRHDLTATQVEEMRRRYLQHWQETADRIVAPPLIRPGRFEP